MVKTFNIKPTMVYSTTSILLYRPVGTMDRTQNTIALVVSGILVFPAMDVSPFLVRSVEFSKNISGSLLLRVEKGEKK